MKSVRVRATGYNLFDRAISTGGAPSLWKIGPELKSRDAAPSFKMIFRSRAFAKRDREMETVTPSNSHEISILPAESLSSDTMLEILKFSIFIFRALNIDVTWSNWSRKIEENTSEHFFSLVGSLVGGWLPVVWT